MPKRPAAALRFRRVKLQRPAQPNTKVHNAAANPNPRVGTGMLGGPDPVCGLFSDIEDIELSGRVFSQVQIHRNNQFYDFLLKVCGLTYRNLLVSEKPGTSK